MNSCLNPAARNLRISRRAREHPASDPLLWKKNMKTLVVTASRDALMVTDQKGSTAHIIILDVTQSNGVILVIDKVRLPA